MPSFSFSSILRVDFEGKRKKKMKIFCVLAIFFPANIIHTEEFT